MQAPLCDRECGRAIQDSVWSREHGEQPWNWWNSDATYSAAENGHLDCLAWAVRDGAPLFASTTFAAASTGQLQCLKCAVQHGAPCLGPARAVMKLRRRAAATAIQRAWRAVLARRRRAVRVIEDAYIARVLRLRDGAGGPTAPLCA